MHETRTPTPATRGRRTERTSGEDVTPQYTVGTDIAAVSRWARVYLAADSIPTLGDATWCALADDDPRKLASAVRAAVAWATETAMLPAILAAQLATDDAMMLDRIKGAALDVSAAADWSTVAARLRHWQTFVEANPWAERVSA